MFLQGLTDLSLGASSATLNGEDGEFYSGSIVSRGVGREGQSREGDGEDSEEGNSLHNSKKVCAFGRQSIGEAESAS